MPKSVFKRSIALLLAAALVSGGVHTAAANNNTDSDAAAVIGESSEYMSYIDDNAEIPSAEDSAEVVLDNAIPADGAELKKESEYNGCKALVWENGNGNISAEFNIPATALYNIELTYYLPEAGVEPEPGIMIDGKYPYSDLEKVTVPREWKNSGAAREDADGNQLTPEQVESGRYTSVLKDFSGVNTEPYLVRLTAGKHIPLRLFRRNKRLRFLHLSLHRPKKRKIIKNRRRKSKTIRRR